jgi:hypothetical protein
MTTEKIPQSKLRKHPFPSSDNSDYDQESAGAAAASDKRKLLKRDNIGK